MIDETTGCSVVIGVFCGVAGLVYEAGPHGCGVALVWAIAGVVGSWLLAIVLERFG